MTLKKGKNIANPIFSKSAYLSFENYKLDKPCIFLSHTRLDKKVIIEIGDYIMEAGFNIYLDIYDKELQQVAKTSDHEAITRCLEKGISNSTHMLCCVSEKTKYSWWVPYEIGYGKSRDKHIATLLLKDFDLENIPSFLYISNILKGIKSLNEYLIQLSNENKSLFEKYSSAYASPSLRKHYELHPLDNILKWNH